MLICDAERASVALILIGDEFDAGPDLYELIGQKQSPIDRAGLQYAHICITQPAGKTFALRNIKTQVDAARVAFGHAVRKDDRGVEEDVRVADISKVAAPECDVQPNPTCDILCEPGFVGG